MATLPTTKPVHTGLSERELLGYVADNLQDILSRVSCFKRNSAQFDKSADTTLAAIPGLGLALTPGVWHVKMWLDLDQTSTGGYKFDFNFTGTATMRIDLKARTVEDGAGSVILIRHNTAFNSFVNVGTSLTTVVQCLVEGIINVTAAGTFDLRFAQNTAAGVGSVLANSVAQYTLVP